MALIADTVDTNYTKASCYKGATNMSIRDDIFATKHKETGEMKPGRLVYSCNCGWIDRGHFDSKSYRDYEGASSLWKQLKLGEIYSELRSADGHGFKITYQQSQTKNLPVNIPRLNEKVREVARNGERRSYYVSRNLSLRQKEQVALAIFQEVSLGFESWQGLIGSIPKVPNSGFSAEDLVSNLLGFYVAVRGWDPSLVESTCGVVSEEASRGVWDSFGGVGAHRNHEFKPRLFPCTECTKDIRTVPIVGTLPPTFQDIAPAKKGNYTFRDWRTSDERTVSGRIKNLVPRPLY